MMNVLRSYYGAGKKNVCAPRLKAKKNEEILFKKEEIWNAGRRIVLSLTPWWESVF